VNRVSIWTLLSLLVVAVFATGCVGLEPVPDAAAAPDDCLIQGAWVGSYTGGPWDTPLILQNVVTPQDPDGEKLTYEMRWVNPDATMRMPESEEVDDASDLVGEAIKTAPSAYDYSVIGYGVNDRPGDRGEIVYLFVVNGSLACEGDATITSDVTPSVYTAAQDADMDGLPDEGELPICIGPTDFGSAHRIPQMSRCEPPE
jgi:hypothetical protein